MRTSQPTKGMPIGGTPSIRTVSWQMEGTLKGLLEKPLSAYTTKDEIDSDLAVLKQQLPPQMGGRKSRRRYRAKSHRGGMSLGEGEGDVPFAPTRVVSRPPPRTPIRKAPVTAQPRVMGSSLFITQGTLPAAISAVQSYVGRLPKDTSFDATIQRSQAQLPELQKQIDTIGERIEQLKQREIDTLKRQMAAVQSAIDRATASKANTVTTVATINGFLEKLNLYKTQTAQRITDLENLSASMETTPPPNSGNSGMDTNMESYEGGRRKRRTRRARRTLRKKSRV